MESPYIKSIEAIGLFTAHNPAGNMRRIKGRQTDPAVGCEYKCSRISFRFMVDRKLIGRQGPQRTPAAKDPYIGQAGKRFNCSTGDISNDPGGYGCIGPHRFMGSPEQETAFDGLPDAAQRIREYRAQAFGDQNLPAFGLDGDFHAEHIGKGGDPQAGGQDQFRGREPILLRLHSKIMAIMVYIDHGISGKISS